MVVLKVLDERFVLVADGDLRKAQHPKKKSVRHLRPHGPVSERIARKAEGGKPVTDQELRDALREAGAEEHGQAMA